jgi:hypothetical protein
MFSKLARFDCGREDNGTIYTYIYTYILLGGIPTPLKKYEFVSWDYSSQYMENQINVPNHQAVRDLTVVTTLTLKALQR